MTYPLYKKVARRYRRAIGPEYYKLDRNMSLEEVSCLWAKENKKLRDAHIHGFFPVKDLWPIREYTWTREDSRSGFVRTETGDYEELSGPEKWDHIKEDMKQNGWREEEQPVLVDLGKKGKAKVKEGNHRLAIARELGMRKVPVKFFFRKEVKGDRLCQEAGPPDLDNLVDRLT